MSGTDINYTVVKSSRYLAKARASSDSLQRHVRVSAEERTPTNHAEIGVGKIFNGYYFAHMEIT